MSDFLLPDLGEGLQEAEIVAWHVHEGDSVVADQPLLSVETDKAVVEVPSPQAGRIAKLFAEAGDVVEVGSPLVSFTEGAHDDAGGVVGRLGSKDDAVAQEPGVEVESAGPRPTVKAAPAVRALARKLGVNLDLVTATGRGGVVTVRDVEEAAADIAEAEPLEPLRGVRRAMAKRMAQANAEIAATTVMEDADIEDWRAGQDVTMRLVRALIAGVAAVPQLNSWYDSAAEGIRVHTKIDLGVAVNTDDGLFVPVLRDVANRDAADLRGGLDRMHADIEARTVPAEELRGATITLTNAGPYRARYVTPIVPPPQVAILGAGRARPDVVPYEGEIAIRRIMPLSLTFDHRAVAGAEASLFLDAVIEDLEKAD
ncbi:MAG: dihydrolipoamide acetyltransferase family protein [Rhodospirillales bacterium]|nr:dihydrolipoamide acetyltransferase family protein [Rhodospirillales bacterium]